jgi:hypothetical protein
MQAYQAQLNYESLSYNNTVYNFSWFLRTLRVVEIAVFHKKHYNKFETGPVHTHGFPISHQSQFIKWLI